MLFQDHFTEFQFVRPIIYGFSLLSICVEEDESLLASFLSSELDKVVAKINGSKSPRPDDFNFYFY